MGFIDHMITNIYKPPRQEKQTVLLSKSSPLEKSAGTAAQTSLTQGQLLKGEVLDLRASQILVLLENGTSVSARTEGTLNLSIGQQASFIVTQTSDEQILLKLAADDTPAQNPMIDKVLTAAHIQKTEHSSSIVTELLSHQQPVNEANLRHYLSLSAKYPEVPIKALVLMELHHIPVTKETAAQFVQYQNRQALLLNQAQELTKELLTSAKQLPEGELRTEIFRELNLLLETNHSETVPENTTASATGKLPNDTSSLPANANISEATTSSEATKHLTAPTTETTTAFSNASESLATENPEKLPDIVRPTSNVKPEDLSAFTDNRPLQNEKTTLEPSFDNRFFHSFLLQPEDIAEPKKIKKYYEELSEKVTKLEQLSQRLQEINTKTAFEMPKQIKQNLSFMEAINNVFPYIQLPLKLKEAPAHGELYVYEKKKGLKPSDSISALLHLELEALGTTDIFVTLTDSHVNTRFSMADKEAQHLVRSELPTLSAALAEKGYTLQSEVSVREPEAPDAPGLLEQFLEEHSPNRLTRYSFDIRA